MKIPENILITAGGTEEKIDRVRSITNKGTGKLGSLIAEQFAQSEEVKNIYYIHAKNAVLPKCDKVTLIPITSTDDLLNAVNQICTEKQIDAVIHSMAVSDYRVRSVLSASTVMAIAQPADGLETLFYFSDRESLTKKYNKIPSDTKDPVIFLAPTPKIIPLFRQLLPQAVIVGFKLLDNVSHEELINTAHRLLIKNGCDYVLANDYTTVEADRHEGFLIDKNKNENAFSGKQAIAEGIAKAVMSGGKL